MLPSLSLPFPSPEPCLLQEACLEYPHLALALSQERFPESCTYVSPFRLAPGARLRFPPSWGLPEGKEGLPLLLFRTFFFPCFLKAVLSECAEPYTQLLDPESVPWQEVSHVGWLGGWTDGYW